MTCSDDFRIPRGLPTRCTWVGRSSTTATWKRDSGLPVSDDFRPEAGGFTGTVQQVLIEIPEGTAGTIHSIDPRLQAAWCPHARLPPLRPQTGAREESTHGTPAAVPVRGLESQLDDAIWREAVRL